MKKIAFITRLNCARWILILGVLAGLCFSSGEGVQLLPFPITESNNSENTSSNLEKNLKSYALSVHNSGNHSPSLKFKFQKQDNKYPVRGHLTFDWSSVRANLFLERARNRKEAYLSHAAVFLASKSDRAPPTV